MRLYKGVEEVGGNRTGGKRGVPEEKDMVGEMGSSG